MKLPRTSKPAPAAAISYFWKLADRLRPLSRPKIRRVSGCNTAAVPDCVISIWAIVSTRCWAPLWRDLSGAIAGDLLIVHNFDVLRRDLNSLRLKLLLTWVLATIACLAISIYLARRVLKPIQELDQAAARVTEQKYEARVSEGGDDELGRLARTFNAMCRSIQDAREELIRHERISTIGRLSSSIVHDLRNPLASIYGGAEMMMDGNLSPTQMQRIAGNIYRSSRAIKDMLQQLVDVSRGRIQTPEPCRLSEVIGAAVETQIPNADQQGVEIIVDIDHGIETPVEPGRMERVFANLVGNAIDAMQGGGVIKISAQAGQGSVIIHVDDNGPGIPAGVRQRLFQPFATSGKNGLGLGLASVETNRARSWRRPLDRRRGG